MEVIDSILYYLDIALSNRQKRHVIGGVLLSASLLFGGLAVTVMTIKKEEKDIE